MDIVHYYRMYLPDVAVQCVGPPDPQIGWVVPVAAMVQKIRECLPHLSTEQVMVALTYWHDFAEEIRRELEEDDTAARELGRKYSRLP